MQWKNRNDGTAAQSTGACKGALGAEALALQRNVHGMHDVCKHVALVSVTTSIAATERDHCHVALRFQRSQWLPFSISFAPDATGNEGLPANDELLGACHERMICVWHCLRTQAPKCRLPIELWSIIKCLAYQPEQAQDTDRLQDCSGRFICKLKFWLSGHPPA